MNMLENSLENRLSGTRDLFPEDHKYFTFLKKVFRHEFRKNGFRRISTPLLEQTSLVRKIYEEKKNPYGIYHFQNRDDIDVSLLPKASVGIMRAYIENDVSTGLQPVYYYYIERFFHQNAAQKELYMIGAEVIGESDAIIDAQNIFIVWSTLQKIGLAQGVKVRINAAANEKEFEKFREALESYFENKIHNLCPETQEKYTNNILAPFFSKNEDDVLVVSHAPLISKYLKKETKQFYDLFQTYLQDLQIPFIEDSKLFSQDSSATHVVWQFEDEAGNIIASGGRYDTLAKKIGSLKDYGAAGFSLDALFLVDVLKEKGISIKNKDSIDLYFVQLGDEAKRVVFPLSLEARQRGINTQASLGTPSMKEQMLKAQRIGAKFIVLVGVMEARNGIFQVRNTENGTQAEVKKEELIEYIIDKIGKDKLDFYEPSKDLLQE